MRVLLQIAAGLVLAALASRLGSRLLGSAELAAPASSANTATASPSAAAPLGPLPAESTAEHAEPVASYTLRASLDPVQHSVRGEGTLVWRNSSREPQRELFVHLYLNGFKNERSAFLRTPIGGFRGNSLSSDFGRIEVKRFAIREMGGADVWPVGRPTSPGDPEDETDIHVALPRPVGPGETITIDLAWDSYLPAIAIRTGHYGSFHMVGQWFPKVARLEPDGHWAHFSFRRLSEFYADFGTYDVTVDVPDGFEVGATGRLAEETRAGGRVGRRFVQEDVHDFAFAAWDGFRELRAVSDGGVMIRCLYPADHDAAAALEIETARFGLAHFGAAFGRYPYGTLTIVHPPEGAEEAGGMEYPTLITTGGSWLAGATGVRLLEGVTIHELAHQWFYGLVATDEHRYPFLDEGLTTYAELDALRARFGDGSAARVLGVELDMRAVYRANAIDSGHHESIAQGAADFIQGSDYAGLVYARAATLLETLGGVYGDELVRRAVGRYARVNRFQHPGPEALLAAVQEVMGNEAGEALRLGIFDRGWVDYTVADLDSEAVDHIAAADSATGETPPAYRGHAFVRRLGTLVFPVDVDMYGADGTVQRVRWDARESVVSLPYAGSSPLAAVVIDPEHRVWLDEDLTNNALRIGRTLLAPRVLAKASFAVGAALTLIGP